MACAKYFKIMLWTPVFMLLTAFLLLSNAGDDLTLEKVEGFFLLFGLPAYCVFAVWATKKINKKTELQVVRLVWWAPVLFFPFYGGAWLISGLGHLLVGDVAGLGMMVSWIVLLPYELMLGYCFVFLVVAVYKIVVE